MPALQFIDKTPGTFIDRQDRPDRSILGSPNTSAAFLIVSRKGPMRKPVSVLGLKDAIRVFGRHRKAQAGIYSLDTFFKNGGSVAHVSRVGHYSDVADAESFVGAAAEETFQGVGVASAARFVGNVDVSSIAVENAQVAVAAIDGGANKTATFTAAAASRASSSSAARDLDNGQTLLIRINGGPVQTITFSTADFADIDLATPDEIAEVINDQIVGARATVSGDVVTITTDRKGTGASINVTGGTANGALGYTVGSLAGTGNVADSSAVTFAEVKTILEAAIKTTTAGDLLVVTQDSSGFLVLTSQTTGALSSIDLKDASTAALVTALGLSGLGTNDLGPATVGAASSQQNAFTFKAGYRGMVSPGTEGNLLGIKITERNAFQSADPDPDLAGNVLADATSLPLTSISGLRAQSVLRITNTSTGAIEYAIVTEVSTVMTGVSIVHTATLLTGLTAGHDAGETKIESIEFLIEVYENGKLVERRDGLSVNPDSDDYILTAFNDDQIGSDRVMVVDEGATFPANILAGAALTLLTGGTEEMTGFVDADIAGSVESKTGVFAFDEVQGFRRICAPPSFGADAGLKYVKANAVQHMALLEYAKTREDCEAQIDIPAGYDENQALLYRQNTLGVDTPWGSLNIPFLKVSDPLGTGKSPSVLIPSSGAVCGLIDRVVSLQPPAGGPHTAAAGEGEYGRIKGILGLEREFDDRAQAILNPVGINVIRHFKVPAPGAGSAPGFLRWGARTLSSDLRYRYEQVRRMMTFIEQSIVTGTRWAVFRDNDEALRSALKDYLDAFFSRLHSRKQLKGTTPQEAFFTKVDSETTTPLDEENGRLIGEFGASLIRPGEFVTWRTYQLPSGGLSVTAV